MNTFDRLSLYGSTPCWSRKGKDKETLEKELNMRLHPKKRNRRRSPRRIHMVLQQGRKSVGKVEQNAHVRTKGFNSWEEAIREAQTSSGQVETSGRTVSSNLVFLKRSDDLPNQPQAVGRNQ